MSQQVASLYAEIGAKIDGFQKGASTERFGRFVWRKYLGYAFTYGAFRWRYCCGW